MLKCWSVIYEFIIVYKIEKAEIFRILMSRFIFYYDNKFEKFLKF